MRGRRGAVAIAAVTAAIALSCVATAAGHSSLSGTTPASGAQLSVAPARVVVTYADPLGAVTAAEVRAGGRDLAGAPRLDPDDRRRLVIPLTGAATGPHRVSWIVVASDGHPMSGELSFSVRGVSPLSVIHRVGAETVRVGGRAVAGVCRLAAGSTACA